MADVAIVGGGYAGLTAALWLSRVHGMKVIILDAGRPGWGASGRNGGFCSAGAAKLSYEVMIRRHGIDETRTFHRALRDSVAHVRDFLSSEGVDADATQGGDLRLAHKRSRIGPLREETAFMNATFGLDQRFLTAGELAERGYCGPHFHAGLLDPEAFGLHPLKYLRGLAAATHRAGAIIFADSQVTQWRMTSGRHVLRTADAEITADKVLLATNGYTPEDVAPWVGGRLLPALSRIMVTRKISEGERSAQGWNSVAPAHDTRDLLHYFRLLPDGRFLFGGRGGIDASPDGMKRSQNALRASFERLFPSWAHIESDYAWSGFVCLTRPLTPYAGPLGDVENAFGAFAWHGNGVAMSGYTGRLMANFIAGTKDAGEAIPAIMRRPLPRFALAPLRRLMLGAIYAAADLRDNWG
jgi:glycine/D-amino acid oxidase-like deaminating enzyme